MFTLSPVEGLARAILSFLPAPLRASNQDSLTSISPAPLTGAPFENDARPSRKSNYSRTSAIPGVGGIYRFSCQTSSSRSCYRNPALCPLSFQTLAHSFIFRTTPIRCSSSIFRTLAPKTWGYTPRSYQSHGFPIEVRSFLFAVNCRLSTVDCWLPARITQHGSHSFFTGRWSPATSSPILPSR
jgi:hypothetical protein